MPTDAALLAVSETDREALLNGEMLAYGGPAKRREHAGRANPKVLARLRRLLGPNDVLTEAPSLRPYTRDRYWLSIAAFAAGRPLGRPDVVVRPRSSQEVARVVEIANETRVPITPWGGGSGVQGAANADRGGIVVDLRQMKKIRKIDTDSMIAIVEAGMYGVTFETELNKENLTFTHYPASIHLATIGGYLAARSSGFCSTRYGKIEDHVLSLEAVLPTGEIIETVSLPRHGMGPELTQLFLGSEGTLGIITAASLKVRPQSAIRAFGTFTFDDVEQGVEACRRIMVTGLRPAVLRLYSANAAALDLSKAAHEGLDQTTLVMILEGHHPELTEAELAKACELCRSCGCRDLGPGIARSWWDQRYVSRYPPHTPTLPAIWGSMDVVTDYAHAMDVYQAMYTAMRPFERKHGLQFTPRFTHWYEWGTALYARFVIPQGPAEYEEAVALHDAVLSAGLEAAFKEGAVLSDHQGVGMRLGEQLERQLGGSFEVLRRIKAVLDPRNIMCPGKLNLGRKPASRSIRKQAVRKGAARKRVVRKPARAAR
jgi:alkyldihydroxyacetonephosphate synthase